ncbi:MAG TPA: DUF3761 domain-containing protein [Burkholderiales bacterium]|nr:DUF3761 domain-containing protein [Burkholderiales bacterium]
MPAGPAPAGSTGTCKDGTYTDSAKKKGACAGHGGVKEWYSTGASKSTGSTPATSQAPAAIPAAAAPAAAASSAPAKPASSPAPTPTQAVAGGGPGKVWVNTESKVYHCPGDRYYGKTKQGEYMSESEAKAMGGRASNGRSCS